MKTHIYRLCIVTLSIFALGAISYGQDRQPQAANGSALTTVVAGTENKSNRKVLIWVDGHEPRTLRDVLGYHIEPRATGILKVTIPENGRIKFIVGDGGNTPTGQYNHVLTSCIWLGNVKTPSKVPNIVYTAGGHLTCGTMTR